MVKDLSLKQNAVEDNHPGNKQTKKQTVLVEMAGKRQE